MIKKRTAWIILFCVCQPLIFYLFSSLGRDNDEYNRLFASRSIVYLEPFWLLYGWFLDATRISKLVSYADALCLFSIATALYFYKVSTPLIRSNIGLFIFTLLVLSYQISFVSGALRQGVAVFAFAAFIIHRSQVSFTVSLITHNSGALYAFFSFKVAFFLVAVMIFAIVLQVVDQSFINYGLSRMQSYLGVDREIFYSKVIPILFSKTLLLAGFSLNRKLIKSTLDNRYLYFAVFLAPIAQLVTVFLVSSPIIVDRGNMVLDPIIIAGMTIICAKPNFLNTTILSLLIFPKFLIRLYLSLGLL